MRTIHHYLDAARARLGLPSDYRLGIELRITTASISTYRTGKTLPDDGTMLRIAEAAGIEPGVALIELNSWRTKSEPAKAAYGQLLVQLSRTAAAGIVALVLAWQAFPGSAKSAGTDTRAPGLYVMENRGRRWLARFLAVCLAVSPLAALAEPFPPIPPEPEYSWLTGVAFLAFGLAVPAAAIYLLRRRRR